jgi:hypothetical protein
MGRNRGDSGILSNNDENASRAVAEQILDGVSKQCAIAKFLTEK